MTETVRGGLKIFQPNQTLVLKGKMLSQALRDLSQDVGLSPGVVADFLAVNPENKITRFEKIAPLVFFISSIAAWMLNYALRDTVSLPLPQPIHYLLQAIHSFPLIKQPVANNNLVEHLPVILGELTLLAMGRLGISLSAKSSLQKKQEIVAQQVQKGEFKYRLNDDFTAAFVGEGDVLANRLFARLPAGEMILLSNRPLGETTHQFLGHRQTDEARETYKERMHNIFDRIQLARAGEIMLFPVTAEDMFLPDPIKGHDMRLYEIKRYIELVDDYCRDKGIEQKSVFIIGSKAMSDTFVRFDPQTKTRKKKIVSLADIVFILNKDRTKKIKVVDPDEIVMQKIIEVAQGRKIDFVSNTDGAERYQKLFEILYKKTKYRPNKSRGMPLRLTYYIGDPEQEIGDPFSYLGGEEAVIGISSQVRNAARKRGIPDKNIIAVSELVEAELEKIARLK